MAIIVDQKVWELFPGMVLVMASGNGINNETERPAIRQMLENAQIQLRNNWQYQNAQSHPHIAAWRQAYQRMGISGKQFPSAIESLSRRVLSGRSLSYINPLVDFYNAISLHYIVPVGGWDIDDIEGGDMFLRLTRGGEQFVELGQPNAVSADAGEVAYADSSELITRHFVWRQSEKAKIVQATNNFFLISEILSDISREVAENVQRAFIEGLREHFGVEARSAIIDSKTAKWEFAD